MMKRLHSIRRYKSWLMSGGIVFVVAVGIYVGVSAMTRHPELAEFRALLRRRLG